MHLLQVMSGSLTVTVAIVGCAALLSLLVMRVAARFGHALAPAQSLAFSGIASFSLLLNANAWIAGKLVFPAALALGSVGIGRAIWRGRSCQHSTAVLWTTVASLLSGAILIAVWFTAFAGKYLWMLEGTNHDLVFFYGGAKWAMQQPLMVDQDYVQKVLALGPCGSGMQFIGTGCAVYRGGTYSLLALAGMLIPGGGGPNAVRAMIGATAVFPVLGMLPWMAGRFAAGRWFPRGGWLAITLVLLAMGCVGIQSAMVNENLGTAAAAAVLVMLTLWAMTPMSSLPVKLLMLGAGAGAATAVYGEAAAYACAIVAVAVYAMAKLRRSQGLFVLGGLVTMAVFALTLNRQLVELAHSYTEISGVVRQQEWHSWYIQQHAWWWFAAPFAGLLMTANPAVTAEAVLLGMLLMAATLVMAVREQRWRIASGLLLVSAALVFYIQSRGYQYGEHKLVQMLGPMWMAVVCWLLARAACRRSNLPLVMVLMGCMAVLSLGFAWRARDIILSHTPAALSYPFSQALQLPRPGDEVVIDASAVQGEQQYIKQDFAIVELHQRGVRALLPDSGRTPVAYSDALFDDSLARAKSPDWVLVLRQPGTSSVFAYPGKPVIEDPSFALYSLAKGAAPVAVAGSGWHLCEATSCWTDGVFKIEVLVPDSCGAGLLQLKLATFRPPSGATMAVEVVGSRSSTQTLGATDTVEAELGAGRSIITLRPGWAVISPAEAGESSDARKLFASIQRAVVQCRSPRVYSGNS